MPPKAGEYRCQKLHLMPGTAQCNRHVRFTPKSGDWRNQCRIRDGSADAAARYVAAFRKGFHETGRRSAELDGLEARSPAGWWRVRRQVARWPLSLMAVAGGRRFMLSRLIFVTVMASYGYSQAGKTGCSHVN